MPEPHDTCITLGITKCAVCNVRTTLGYVSPTEEFEYMHYCFLQIAKRKIQEYGGEQFIVSKIKHDLMNGWDLYVLERFFPDLFDRYNKLLVLK